MSILKIEDFENIAMNQNTGLIVGNGFSMNFDTCFSDIYGLLRFGTKQLIKKGSFKISPAAKPQIQSVIMENYKSVLNYVRSLSQAQLEEIFEDGIKFAEFIINSEELVTFLKQNKYIHKTDVAPDMIEIIKQIYKIGHSKGFSYVNIENWTVLMWVYYLIKDNEKFINFRQKPNLFITLISLGGRKTVPEAKVMHNTRFNGFYNYYRFLMITIIFNNGKSVDLNLLNKIDELNKDSITEWVNSFKELFSLNYDLILELVSGRPVTYLHGNFKNKVQGFTFFKSYHIKYKDKDFYTNSIILGDYTTTKVIDSLISQVAFHTHPFTEPYEDALDKLQGKLTDSKINHIVFFGMNPENDYHILSGICFQYIVSNTKSPMITFCYYNETEIDYFRDVWSHVLKTIYNHKKDYTDTIKINFLDSKEVINRYFRIANNVKVR